MALHLVPVLAKTATTIAGAYVTYHIYKTVANQVNNYLDENHPEIEFRLNAKIIEWGCKLVKSSIETAISQDRTGELKKQFENAGSDVMINLFSAVIAEGFVEFFNYPPIKDHVEIVTCGVCMAFNES